MPTVLFQDSSEIHQSQLSAEKKPRSRKFMTEQGNAVILCVNWLENGKEEELAEKVDNILKRK